MGNKTMLEQELSDFEQLEHNDRQNGPVECLGKMFTNDQERREYYLEILAEKLKDPEFCKIEGFPIGEDEDILNLSDPPYYTACPNPFIGDFIAYYGRPYDANEQYKREPYAADVSEGKSDPIYNAHSYHTKVPHKAIMRYILHYTNPGDVVFDGFCGTGMTGVAAQLCANKEVVESLGYRVLADGTILHEIKDKESGKTNWEAFSKLGARIAILNDLSPAATFISYNYNNPIDAIAFDKEAKKIIDEVEQEYGWVYETLHSDGETVGKINYTVWSDVFICPTCNSEVVFWEAAVDNDSGKVSEKFPCSSCQSELTKKNLTRAFNTTFDTALGKTISQAKQIPVLINYSANSISYNKRPDSKDLDLIQKINDFNIPFWYPTARMIEGKETRRNDKIGITHVHHYYSKRSLIILSALRDKMRDDSLLLLFNSQLINISKLNRYRPGVSFPYNPLSGTYYIGSQVSESCVLTAYRNKLKKLVSAFKNVKKSNLISNESTTNGFSIHVDYIFIDPPFGGNLNYSELSSLWEEWLKVRTNNKEEAIENIVQNKGPNEYRNLISKCFSEAYKVLKPGRWMTVEFSNTKSTVWNSIQTAIAEAGFIIANVSALDKQQGSFKAVTTPTAVKQDLVISAYKPNGGFENRFVNESDEDGVWDFIRTHLGYLPVVKKEGSELVKIPERDPRILFDQVVAYFIRSLRDVPLSSREFQQGLLERFAERDGMIFLPEQVAQYDKSRITSSQLRQLTIFVDDEASAIEWLRQLLNDKPQTYQDIHPKFLHELSGWKKAELQLELSTLLSENFLKFDGQGQVPPQIHSYLSTNFKDFRGLAKDDFALLHKAKDRWYVPNPEREEDLQKLRERSLLKQFEEYKNHIGKKIKLVRMEAVRVGFKKAWQERDYATIIQVAEKIPEDLLQEDQKLLMWYDQAQTRHSGSSLF